MLSSKHKLFHCNFSSRVCALLAAIALILLAEIGCGGNTSNNASPPQPPVPQPANPPSNNGPQSAQNGGTGSGNNGGSGGSGMNNPANNPQIPSNATTQSAIQTLSGWQWCTAMLNGHPCAGGLGNATSSMNQNQQTPSLSGMSSQFTLGGPTQYSNALWWKSFGPDSTPTHFVYDLYFYMDNPNFPEALEFDVNQSFNGVRYTWGTECSYHNTGYWDVWNPETEHWETTSVGCPVVSAQTWHHLTWQVERVNGQVHYTSISLDGNMSTVDKYYNPQQNYQGSAINVAFQMDGDYRQDPYDVWLDNVSLSYW